MVTGDEPASLVSEIARSYLYKDVLEFQTVKNPDLLHRLLQALALQIGSEVSFNELAALLGIDKATVARYVSLNATPRPSPAIPPPISPLSHFGRGPIPLPQSTPTARFCA